ncbi:MAG: VanZ family protein [Bacteroidales bacterium]|nr:VanZ family protein [Bacteroidales bacterium]
MNFLKKYKLSIIWALIMLLATTMKPGDEMPKIEIPYMDKIVHFGIFGVLGFLITYEKRRADLLTLALCAAFGAAIEVIQSFLPWRSFEWADMLADTLGALAGLLVGKWLISFAKSRK